MPSKPPLPEDIPKHPHGTYRDTGWAGYDDWLGTGTISARSTRSEAAEGFVKDQSGKRTLLITGMPGSGKTALSKHLFD